MHLVYVCEPPWLFPSIETFCRFSSFATVVVVVVVVVDVTACFPAPALRAFVTENMSFSTVVVSVFFFILKACRSSWTSPHAHAHTPHHYQTRESKQSKGRRARSRREQLPRDHQPTPMLFIDSPAAGLSCAPAARPLLHFLRSSPAMVYAFLLCSLYPCRQQLAAILYHCLWPCCCERRVWISARTGRTRSGAARPRTPPHRHTRTHPSSCPCPASPRSRPGGCC